MVSFYRYRDVFSGHLFMEIRHNNTMILYMCISTHSRRSQLALRHAIDIIIIIIIIIIYKQNKK